MCRFIPSKRLPSPGNAILAGAVFWRRSSCYGGRRPSGCCLLHGMQHRRRRRDRGSTSSKPPVIPDPGGRPDYIAAARRAAQVAAAASPRARAATAAKGPSLPGNLTQRLRKLIVAAAVVVIIVGGVHIALRLSSRTPAPAHPRSRGWSRESAAPAGRGAGDCSHRAAASTQGPKVIQLPVPGASPAPAKEPPACAPPAPVPSYLAPGTGTKPRRQSLNDDPPPPLVPDVRERRWSASGSGRTAA